MASPRNAFFRLPSTKTGKWTVVLAGIFMVMLITYNLMPNIFLIILLPVFALGYLTLGLIAVFSKHERSWLVWLVTIIPLIYLIFGLFWLILMISWGS